MNLEELVDTFRHEYDSLSDEEKQKIVETFDERRQVEETAKIKFPTLKGRTKSAAEIFSTVVQLVSLIFTVPA
jgi:hypothetical protein